VRGTNPRIEHLHQALGVAARRRALRDHAEDLLGRALVATNPEERAELADDALAAVAAMQRAEQEATT
jgi:hypothetical protein